MHHEQALIAAFVKSSKRERYREFVSNPRLRHKFTRELPHFRDFDPRYRVPIPNNRHFPESIARELQKRRCPSIVHAISEDSMLDQQDWPLMEALEKTVGWRFGTVLSCIPGRLAFVETEDERFILERHDSPEKREYIRFVIGRKHENSHVETGIFQAVAEALNSGRVTEPDAAELYWLREWFNENLERPTSFGRSQSSLGICWFKSGSAEHISRIWGMVTILERHGIYVKKIRTDRPGYVVYEDEWQLVAEPFRKGTLGKR